MARPIICDGDDCGLDATVILSDLEDGSVTNYCMGHWLGFIVAVYESINAEMLKAEPGPATNGDSEPVPATSQIPGSPMLPGEAVAEGVTDEPGPAPRRRKQAARDES